MNASVRLRPASLADLDALLALEKWFPSDRVSRASWRRFIASSRAYAPVAADATGLLGNLILLTRANTRAARIYSVVVAPSARGRGIGEQLVAAAEAEARRRSCVSIYLEVRADNLAARALYLKRGYVPVRELAGYYDDGADGLRLSKSLSHLGHH